MAGCCGPAHRTFLFHKMPGYLTDRRTAACQEGLRYMHLFIYLSLDDELCVYTPYIFIGWQRRFGGAFCLHLQGDVITARWTPKSLYIYENIWGYFCVCVCVCVCVV